MRNAEYKRKGENTPAPLSPFEQAQINAMYKNSIKSVVQSLLTLIVYVIIAIYVVKIYKIEKARADRDEVCIEAGANK